MQKSIFLKCTAVLFLVRPQGLFMSVFIGSWGAAIVPRLVYKGGKTKTNRKSKTRSSLSYLLSTEILTHFSYCDSPFRIFRWILYHFLFQRFQLQLWQTQDEVSLLHLVWNQKQHFQYYVHETMVLVKILWNVLIFLFLSRHSVHLDSHYKFCLAFCTW